jgi:hypothetical protein
MYSVPSNVVGIKCVSENLGRTTHGDVSLCQRDCTENRNIMFQINQQHPWTKNFKASSCSASQEIPNILCNRDLNGRVHFRHLSLSWAKLSMQLCRSRRSRRFLHNTQQAQEAKHTSMPSAGFEIAIPVIERPQTQTLFYFVCNFLQPPAASFSLRSKQFAQHPIFKLSHLKFLPKRNLACSAPLLSNRQTVI